MKVLACDHIWWPRLDDDIETICTECEARKKTAAMPVPSNPWQYPSL